MVLPEPDRRSTRVRRHQSPAWPGPPTYSWLFDDAVGTDAVAMTGDQDGILSTGASFDGAETPLVYSENNSIVFDGGANALVTAAGMAGRLNGLSAFTLSIWINSDVINDRGIVHTTDNLFWLRNDAVSFFTGHNNVFQVAFSTTGGTLRYHSAESTAATDQWIHLAMVYDKDAAAGERFKFYINGVRDVPTDYLEYSGTLTAANALVIGNADKNQKFDGHIDEPAIWDRALTAGEVEWLAQNSLWTPPATVFLTR